MAPLLSSLASYRYIGRLQQWQRFLRRLQQRNGDHSGEFPPPPTPPPPFPVPDNGGAAAPHRLVISCDADYTDEVVSGPVSVLNTPSAPTKSQRRAAMELCLLAKHNNKTLAALLSHPDPQLQEHSRRPPGEAGPRGRRLGHGRQRRRDEVAGSGRIPLMGLPSGSLSSPIKHALRLAKPMTWHSMWQCVCDGL